jgi:hypothetical protein
MYMKLINRERDSARADMMRFKEAACTYRRDNFRNLLESIVQPLFPNVYDFAFINNDFIQVRLRQKDEGQRVINTEVVDTTSWGKHSSSPRMITTPKWPGDGAGVVDGCAQWRVGTSRGWCQVRCNGVVVYLGFPYP